MPPAQDPIGATFALRAASLTGNFFLMLGGFYLAGLLLAFTPCVLPMVPILSGIIFGGGGASRPGALPAVASYVLGMALTYTVAGIAGRRRAGVQALFQQWWVLALFAALFVALALSMFGLFTLQMPAAIQTRLAGLSNRQSAGTFGGVAVMGALSALIVTTCVGPALVGALLVISQTGQMARGGAALFTMSYRHGNAAADRGRLGGQAAAEGRAVDGLREAAVRHHDARGRGVDAGARSPRASDAAAMGGAGAGAGLAAVARGAQPRGGHLALRAAGLAAALYGVTLAAGAALGGNDPLAPIPLS